MTAETVLGLVSVTLTPVVQGLKSAAARSWTAIVALVCLAALLIAVIEVVRSDWCWPLLPRSLGWTLAFDSS